MGALAGRAQPQASAPTPSAPKGGSATMLLRLLGVILIGALTWIWWSTQEEEEESLPPSGEKPPEDPRERERRVANYHKGHPEMTSVTSTLDALAPTTAVVPDRRFLGALDRMAVLTGAPFDLVDVRPSGNGGGNIVTVGANPPYTLPALPTAAELWTIVDAQAAALQPDKVWSDVEAKPSFASFTSVSDVERALGTLTDVSTAVGKGRKSREDLRRWCAGLIALLVATPADDPGSDALASEAIAATALANALGMDMSVERALIEHVLGYTAEATANAPSTESPSPSALPPAIRIAVEQPGRLRDATTLGTAKTELEWEMLLRTVPRDGADTELGKQVNAALARIPNAPGLGAFALAVQWEPVDAPKQARRVLSLCAPGRPVPPPARDGGVRPPAGQRPVVDDRNREQRRLRRHKSAGPHLPRIDARIGREGPALLVGHSGFAACN